MSTGTPTRIELIRHGETDWNIQGKYQGTADVPLNAEGRRQVALLAEAMEGETWDAIVSSPLQRAYDTARAVAHAVGLAEIPTDPRLMERAYGEAEGLTLPEREAKWPGGDWPGLEDWENVSIRAMTALHELVERRPGQRVLVVCHGGLINAVLATVSHGEIGTGKTTIINTSRTTLEFDGAAWRIVAVNDTAHLDAALAAD
ncbi:MAG TPA: histidine phosphatase family protein [Thermomicrobiales bacterium]|nr:histidine phosphatase family protein [Thermomicrobiales bacterium]